MTPPQLLQLIFHDRLGSIYNCDVKPMLTMLNSDIRKFLEHKSSEKSEIIALIDLCQGYFMATFGCYEKFWGKPHPDIFIPMVRFGSLLPRITKQTITIKFDKELINNVEQLLEFCEPIVEIIYEKLESLKKEEEKQKIIEVLKKDQEVRRAEFEKRLVREMEAKIKELY
tara:strand:- start:223 stop:732 length:510 start_codon:yes stop_codon:yes gene_type:complete